MATWTLGALCREKALSILPNWSMVKDTSLPLTTTMVNSKNPNKLIKNPTLPPGLQDSSKGIGESLDSLNLLSRASFRAGK